MGPRQNRKRIRHRPNRARKALELLPSPVQPSLFDGSQPLPPTKSIRYHYPSKPCLRALLACNPDGGQNIKAHQECETAWDRRVFGGLEGETDSGNLRGAMMDVVLGLFNGVDYDDALC